MQGNCESPCMCLNSLHYENLNDLVITIPLLPSWNAKQLWLISTPSIHKAILTVFREAAYFSQDLDSMEKEGFPKKVKSRE